MGIRKVGTGEVTTSCVVFCLILLQGSPVSVSGNEGESFLIEKEQQVAKIVDQAIRNYERQCDLFKTCVKNCTHQSCAPLVGDAANSTCVNVTNSRYCRSASGEAKCGNMNFDYRSSYVRIPEKADIKSRDTQLAICAQRELDVLFKSISTHEVLSRVYFASVDGIWRTFPGSAQNRSACGKFDPRVRPWYGEATSVKKVVVILIDIGASMISNLPPGSGSYGTILEAAQLIVTEFLRTLSNQDYVNIVVFNSTGAVPLSPPGQNAVLVKTAEGNNGTIDPELQFLLAELKKQRVEGNSRQSNLSAAMTTGLESFKAADNLAAKVMVVITDGKFASPTMGNVTSLPTSNLSTLGVKTFIYKLPRADDLDKNWEQQPARELLEQLKAVGGHFELIEKGLENPLFAIRSFFTYTANLNRALTKDRPARYSSIYEEFDNVGGKICTVSKTAFASNGELIGVAGITLYIDWLGSNKDQVDSALRNKTTGYSSLQSPIVLTTENYTLKSKEIPCPGQNAIHSDEVVCPQTDYGPSSTIENLTCCGSCKLTTTGPPPQPTPADPSPDSSSTARIVGSIAGAVVLGFILGLLFLLRNHPRVRRLTGTCCKGRSSEQGDAIFEFPGPAHGSPVPLKQ